LDSNATLGLYQGRNTGAGLNDSSMSEEEKLTARERRKLLREFSELGRDAVRYNLQVGGYGVAQRRDLAFEWLREQEAEADKIRRWTLYAAVIAAAVAVITLLATLGVIK
jgi:hypothetical protein